MEEKLQYAVHAATLYSRHGYTAFSVWLGFTAGDHHINFGVDDVISPLG